MYKGTVVKIQLISAAAVLALSLSGPAVASDIYKWVDEDGNVHYGDKPVGEQSERLAIASKPTDPSRVQAEVQAIAETRARIAETELAAASARTSEEEMRAEAEERAQKCAESRATMQRFVTSRRLYREDEAGERVYLDEAETQAARQRVEDQINEYCGR